jgi:hypothetical protein
MIPQLNIISMIDAIAVMSDDSYEGNFHMVDNSRGKLTTGKGTDSLSTQTCHGQVFNWHVWPINVQMDVVVCGIRWYRDGALITNPDDEPVAASKFYGAPSGSYWAAIVKNVDGIYQYQLQVNIAGDKSWITSFPQILVTKQEI